MRLLCPWNTPGKNTGESFQSLLQGIFSNKGSNFCLLLSQTGSLPLSLQVTSKIWTVVKLIMVFIHFSYSINWQIISPISTDYICHNKRSNTFPLAQGRQAYWGACLYSPHCDLGFEQLLGLPESSNHSSKDMSLLASQGWPSLWLTHLFGVWGAAPLVLASSWPIIWDAHVVKSLSHVQLFVTPWIVARWAPPFIKFSRQEYWSGLTFPSPIPSQFFFFFFFFLFFFLYVYIF